MLPIEGRQRVQIEKIYPAIDCGRFPIKRIIGEQVQVEATVFTDSHDLITSEIVYRRESETEWHHAPMYSLINDRASGVFTVENIGNYYYSVRAWVDHFKTWRRDLQKRVEAGQNVAVDLLIGAELVEKGANRASGEDHDKLHTWAAVLKETSEDQKILVEKALSEELFFLISKYPDRSLATTYERELKIIVDREKARFSTWYEMFPRSCGTPLHKHGTFKDGWEFLPYIAGMGFDVLYLPPIHPIGHQFRKGKNNQLVAEPDDVGVCWGIGSHEGGHKSVHPLLGTLEDFREFVAKAKEHNLEIALDIAFQCSPDHPYVKDHPQWFKHRPDGTIQYAENPPKKYQDIYPIDFETPDWQNLWQELKSVMVFWIEQGVHIFRVDNPHTKAFPFWEWAIASIKHDYPDIIFLSESFTRPNVMYRLAKLGFTQSYTYFTWRNNKWDLTEYMTELTRSEVKEFFHPNFWPNTPDILHEYLQHGGRPAFMIRLALAATLTANYGIYGPAFEVCENRAVRPGSEEYLDSEKYQLREWDLDSPYSIQDWITRANRARREHPALQSDYSLRFHYINNDRTICYTKQTPDNSDVMLMVVNLDPHWTQSGWLDLPLETLGIDPYRPYQLHDLFTDAQYTWSGGHNYVELNPYDAPAHLFWIKQQ
ncbi:MAG: alpha-1,4-glucan--maltose-1-phosphate maltosyltransferase [Oscillatoria sp. PMC 1051.18]|nr:alpha-1,4-glucan--maltose-1-phosphate maltosyltransferase [Oscillatoria sp. PMC 1050.18]MEC5030187.1 alpha-1,4-glucan--maltose-1-phosphate maltosyltransferase [Oscillatoria sp. PMC 1051.18]